MVADIIRHDESFGQFQPRRRGRPRKDAQAETGAAFTMRPMNPMAERNFLGSVLIDPEILEECADWLQPSDFSSSQNSTVWDAIQRRYRSGKAVDLEGVCDELMQMKALAEIGGVTTVTTLANGVPSSTNYASYADDILRCSIKWQQVQIATSLAATAYDAGQDPYADAQSFIQKLESLTIRRLSVGHQDGYSLRELMAMELPETRYVVPGLLPEGLTLLAAKQKIGKSWLCLGLGIASAAGGRALGTTQVERGETLYLALEDSPKRIQDRTRTILNNGLVPDGLDIHFSWPRLDQGGLVKLEQWLKTHPRARLAMIDVLAKVRPPRQKNGDMYAEDYAVMSPLKALADKYHVAIVVIHHTRKASADDVFDEIRDSSGLTGACDAVMVLQRARGEVDATLHITGRDVQESQYAMRFDSITCTWQIVGNAEEYAGSSERVAIKRVLAEAPEPLTPQEIAEVLGGKSGAVRQLLWKMERDGEIKKTDRAKYSSNNNNNHNSNNIGNFGNNRVTDVTAPSRASNNSGNNASGQYSSGFGRHDNSIVTDVTALSVDDFSDPPCYYPQHQTAWRFNARTERVDCVICHPDMR